MFLVQVHDNRLLDYEQRHFVECYVVAKELGRGNYTARAKLTVVLNDANDNPPHFVKEEFKGNVPGKLPKDLNRKVVFSIF